MSSARFALRIQCDEIWSLCYAKANNGPADKKGTFGFGDLWTRTAIDADSKLVASWCVGGRSADTAFVFTNDLASRLRGCIQLATDGAMRDANRVMKQWVAE